MTLRASDAWNPFMVFRFPTQTVKDAFEVPKIGWAVGLVAIPVVLGALLNAVVGLPFDAISFGADLVIEWLVWLVSAGILLALAKRIGKGENARFNGIATGLSLLRVLQIGFIVFFFIAVLLFPSVSTGARQFQEGVVTLDEWNAIVAQAIQNITTVQLVSVLVLFLLSFALLLLWLYAFYRVIEQSFQLTAFKHIVLGIILLIVFGVLSNALYSIVPW